MAKKKILVFGDVVAFEHDAASTLTVYLQNGFIINNGPKETIKGLKINITKEVLDMASKPPTGLKKTDYTRRSIVAKLLNTEGIEWKTIPRV